MKRTHMDFYMSLKSKFDQNIAKLNESFIPIETEMILARLAASGDHNDMVGIQVLSQVLNYVKQRPVIPERFAEIYVFGFPTDLLQHLKSMEKQELANLANWALAVLNEAKVTSRLESYMKPAVSVVDYINWVLKKQD